VQPKRVLEWQSVANELGLNFLGWDRMLEQVEMKGRFGGYDVSLREWRRAGKLITEIQVDGYGVIPSIEDHRPKGGSGAPEEGSKTPDAE